MPMTGVLRPGIIQLRVMDLDDAIKHYVDRLGLLMVSREKDGRVYLRGRTEFDHHSIVLREAPSPGMDFVAFKVAGAAELKRLGDALKQYGLEVSPVKAGEQPGVGERIAFKAPTGHRIELYAETEKSKSAPPTLNPDIWIEEPRGMRATRFDHCLLYGPNVEKSIDLFTKVLGFGLAEKIEAPDGVVAAFLSCSNKAHDIAFIKHDVPDKFHHVSFYLESWHDVGHAADLIARFDIPLDVGPTRHGITQGQTIYFFDPSGNRNEVFAGGYFYYPDEPTRVWSADQIGKGIFYYEKRLSDRFVQAVT